jgi:2-keto-4-pentenoate hydratase/2-oxohepta-3-ene-1,7-dioic acid hydratase in catechol pathway
MRLATRRTANGHELCVEVDGGLLRAAALAPSLERFSDVGELLRAGPAALDQLEASIAGGLPATMTVTPLDEVQWAPPILRPSKIIGIGLNYRRHAAEGGVPVPEEPVVFAKFPNSLIGCGEPILYPSITTELDYEAELAVVIGTTARQVDEADALSFVAGYMCANDVSARDLQHGLPGGQWVYGKTLDTFCPTGPFLVTADEIPDLASVRVQAWVNGELRQDEVCGDMVFGVEELIAYLSRALTLEPGDVILTGTPSGVGLGFKPPQWLAVGDEVDVELTGMGRLHSVVSTPESSRT